MHAEIVTTGTELLLGEIVDTNAAYIARRLRTIGLNLFYKTTVGDNEERMTQALQQALARSDVIITTGGLGPTVDDVTRQAIARATGRKLVLDEELLASIEERYARWGRPMSPNNRQQAYKPEGAIGIKNPVGTAPIFIVEQGAKIIICLPGVPREMEYLMEHEVLPYLRRKLGLRETILVRNLRTCAVGESNIDSLIGDLEQETNPTVGLSAHAGQTDVRITAKAETEEEARQLIAKMEARVRERLGDVIYGMDGETVEGVVAELLHQKGLTVALVETNTLGHIAQRLMGASGERIVCKGSLVAASDAVLRQILSLPDGSLDAEKLAIAAAEAVRVRFEADLGLAVIGSPGTEEGPYGRTSGHSWIALSTAEGPRTREYPMSGRNDLAQVWVGTRVLDTLRRHLLGLPLAPSLPGTHR